MSHCCSGSPGAEQARATIERKEGGLVPPLLTRGNHCPDLSSTLLPGGPSSPSPQAQHSLSKLPLSRSGVTLPSDLASPALSFSAIERDSHNSRAETSCKNEMTGTWNGELTLRCRFAVASVTHLVLPSSTRPGIPFKSHPSSRASLLQRIRAARHSTPPTADLPQLVSV